MKKIILIIGLAIGIPSMVWLSLYNWKIALAVAGIVTANNFIQWYSES